MDDSFYRLYIMFTIWANEKTCVRLEELQEFLKIALPEMTNSEDLINALYWDGTLCCRTVYGQRYYGIIQSEKDFTRNIAEGMVKKHMPPELIDQYREKIYNMTVSELRELMQAILDKVLGRESTEDDE